MKIQVYDEEAIRNLQLQEVAKNIFENGGLTPPQYARVQNEFPVELKQSNIFIRLGLFLFTSLCIGFSIGLATLIFSSARLDQGGIGVLSILYGIGLTALNEMFIKTQHWYRQGSDNAFCYASVLCFVVGICLLAHFEQTWVVALLFCVFLTAAAVRFGDPLLALAAFFTLLFTFFDLINSSQITHLASVFVGVSLSIAVYFLSDSASKRDDLFYWSDCFMALKIAALFVLYVSINYWFVENSFGSLFPKPELVAPFNYVFAFLTACLPIVYLYFGIKNKDRILWTMGSLGIVASILTYRVYHAIMPIEWALTLAGGLVLALAIFLIQYLKNPRNGFVYLNKQSKTSALESLVMNQILQQAATSSTPENGVKFGGGDFDGGGAEGSL